jgi:HEAT repeat protein
MLLRNQFIQAFKFFVVSTSADAQLSIFFRAPARSRSAKISMILFVFICTPIPAAWTLDKNLTQASQQVNAEKLEVCLPAIEMLGRSHNGDAVAPLTLAFDLEKRPLVRRYIVDALGQLGSRDGQPTLVKALKDSDSQVRQSAVVALSSFGDAASQQAIINQAQTEKNFAVKANYAQALGRSRHRDSAKKLEAMSRDADPKLRKIAQDEIQKRNKRTEK